MKHIDHSKPWWKQLWPWLIISGPAIVMVACIATIYLAYTKDSDPPIREGVMKRGFKTEELRK
jgi:hypothetical protein